MFPLLAIFYKNANELQKAALSVAYPETYLPMLKFTPSLFILLVNAPIDRQQEMSTKNIYPKGVLTRA